MFTNVSHNYNEKNDTWTFRANFGIGFKGYIENYVMGKKKSDQLFRSISFSEITIDSFFLLELSVMIRMILDGQTKYSSWVNHKSLKSLLDVILKETWLNPDEYNGLSKFELNTKKIDENMRVKPMPFQVSIFSGYELVKNILGYNGMLLDASTGTGKTLMSLMLAESLESEFVIMITMKANMETVWLDTLINDSKDSYPYKKKINRDDVFVSTDAYKNKAYNGQKFILFNYEAIDKLLQILPYIRHKKTTIIVDEAHNFTSLNSNRKNNLVRFCKESNSKDILLLSGTPIKATSLDMMPYLELIDPKFNPVVAARFKKLYSSPNYILKTCVPIRYGTMSVKIEKEVLNLAPIEYSTVVVNLKDGDKYTLNNIKKDMQDYITFRIKELEDNILHFRDIYNKLLDKAKASLSIPAKAWMDYENNFKLVNDYYQKRQLMFHADLIKNVNEFEKAMILPVLKGEEKQNFREAAVVLKYPMLKVRGEVLGKVVLGARIECHKEMAKVLNYEILNSTSAKSIVMSSYIDVCEAAYDASKKAGFNPVKIYGEETKNQTANISKFIEDDKTDPAIGTYKSISTGHHLVVADLVLLMDVPFRTYTLDQAIARVYRMGQKNIVHILYTKLDTGEDYNINSRNIDILKWAKDAVEEITGNTIKGLDFDKGKEIANDIAAGLENDVKGDWEYTQSAVLLSSNFMDWLAGLEDNNNSMETEDIQEDSGLLSDRCIPKEKSYIGW